MKPFHAGPTVTSGGGPGDAKAQDFSTKLAEMLLSAGAEMTVVEAQRQLRNLDQFKRVGVGEFLLRLRAARRVTVTFAEPSQPKVRLNRLTASQLAFPILMESTEPLSAEEIYRRAVARFGQELVGCEARAIGNALHGGKGVYLVGSGLFGVEKHFHVPTTEWNRVRNEFAKILDQQNRQVSAYEAVNDRLISGVNGARAHEIAAIVRQGARFTDLGFLLFALAKSVADIERCLKPLPAFLLDGHSNHPLQTEDEPITAFAA